MWKCPFQHELEGKSSLFKEESVNFLNWCWRCLQGYLGVQIHPLNLGAECPKPLVWQFFLRAAPKFTGWICTPRNWRGMGSQGLGSVANVPVASQTAVGTHFRRKIAKEAIFCRKEISQGFLGGATQRIFYWLSSLLPENAKGGGQKREGGAKPHEETPHGKRFPTPSPQYVLPPPMPFLLVSPLEIPRISLSWPPQKPFSEGLEKWFSTGHLREVLLFGTFCPPL